MSRINHTILIEPIGEDFSELLEAAMTECKFVLLVVRDSVDMSDQARNTLECLSSFLISDVRLSEWPGTKLLNGEAQVLTYKFGKDALAILEGACSGLYQWLQPSLPEDLCLLRADHTPWLVSIAHEKDAYLNLTDSEEEQFLLMHPKLASMLDRK